MPISEPRTIRLRGVRVHNLKSIDLDLPRDRLIAVTGVSGSGKSSLAFDTLYAEGQRRYIETFSSSTRQFLEVLDKPDADRIEGLPPAIAVGQQAGTRRSGRTTVGSVTEIEDHLALLFARLGRVICRTCGIEVRPAEPSEVVAAIEKLPERTRYEITSPVDMSPETDHERLAASLREEGFARVRIGEHVVSLDPEALAKVSAAGPWEVVVDRLVHGSEDPGRRLDSIETAFDRGLGRCRLVTEAGSRMFLRGWRCGNCGTEYHQPEPALFRPNNPVGACPTCEGFGRVSELDLDRIVPDRSKTLRGGAILPWTTPGYRDRLDDLLAAAPGLGLPVDVPFNRLEPKQVALILDGGPGFVGLREFFRLLERKTYKMHVRVFLSRWRSYRPCEACGGARLRPEALAVRLRDWNFAELAELSVHDAREALAALTLEENPIGRQPARQVLSRLDFLERIGLGYLTLNRPARTLSGGEARRVALAAALGSGLVNALFVLDEPSIGLHPRDIGRLVSALTALRDSGNSVVVVEHDRAILEAADLIVDIGPGAGRAGGQVLYCGPPEGLKNCEGSLTGDFLAGRRRLPVPVTRRTTDRGRVVLQGARGNNLKDIDVSFPLGVLCVLTGVSGAGKSTLLRETLYPALARRLKGEAIPAAPYGELRGGAGLGDVVLVDQTPIGRTPRSNPVTYLKAYDEIRRTFAATHEAKIRNLGPGAFSFNVAGGRCSVCAGNGYRLIDMQFLPDILVTCPECRGTRFRPEILEVTYRGKSIAEVLDLTVREAFSFFRHRPRVQARLRPLIDVGLEYLRLGQPTTTLSGGEAQRLKLAAFLGGSAAAITQAASGPRTIFLLDEPTAGLHPADIVVLLDALNRLLDIGHSLVVVEHHPEFLASADWIIDLGPEGGAAGGRIVAEGTPEDVARSGTYTGAVLAGLLKP